MNLHIDCTNDGVITYPLHDHKTYEIMYYLVGEGFLKTEKSGIPFSPGTIIITPPGFLHGSTSTNGFKNITVEGNFKHLLNTKEPIVIRDNAKGEGKTFATLLYENRFGNQNFLSSLCETYILFLLSRLNLKCNIDVAINNIIDEISRCAYDQNFDLKQALLKSGYAEDYIRNQFKLNTGKTPTQFLTEIRIARACHLTNIYKNTLSLTQIAEQCGFVDYIVFSKCFKKYTGLSPSQYKNGNFNTE